MIQCPLRQDMILRVKKLSKYGIQNHVHVHYSYTTHAYIIIIKCRVVVRTCMPACVPVCVRACVFVVCNNEVYSSV